MVSRRRVVIISHPDFDLNGIEGIEQAKQFAETLIQGQREMIKIAEKSGEPPGQIARVRDHTKLYKIAIRIIDEDSI